MQRLDTDQVISGIILILMILAVVACLFIGLITMMEVMGAPIQGLY